MTPQKKKRSTVLPLIDVDRIGALPDSILHHVLSFLPAQEAVQTCVLARRWRHLWRSTTGLRIDDEHLEFQRLRKFVEQLLILRERTDLDTVDISLRDPLDDDVQHYVNLWIRFAVMCKVRVLNLERRNFGSVIYLDNLPLVSRHLRTLDLGGVTLQGTFLDFASCPALEDLKINVCTIRAGKASSRSLKHLSITDCWIKFDCRLHVCTPGLVSLNLLCFGGRTPFLDNMPLLETAFVEFDKDCSDVCLNSDSGVSCGDKKNACKNCVPIDGCRSDCVLLGGISSAKHLKLLSEPGKLIFTRDLKHCPTFSKLKTLYLNEYWCESPDLDPVACILKNSPVLEKLTLQLFSMGPDHEVEMKGRYCSTDRPSAISEHLNIIEVKCNVVDKRIIKVLKFLSASNICFSFE